MVKELKYILTISWGKYEIIYLTTSIYDLRAEMQHFLEHYPDVRFKFSIAVEIIEAKKK